MAGRKKSKRSSKKGRRASSKKSYAGLTRAQLIARLRAASAKKRGGKKRRKGHRARQYGPKRPSKHYLAGVAAGRWREPTQAELNEEAEMNRFNDPGRRRRKGKKGGKKAKRGLSAWQRFIKANKNRRGMRKKNGMLNLKALASAYRKSPAGRKAKKATRKAPKRRSKAKKRSSRRDYGWY